MHFWGIILCVGMEGEETILLFVLLLYFIISSRFLWFMFCGWLHRYATSLENKRADLFERPDDSPAENNGLLASCKHMIQFFFMLNATVDASVSNQLKYYVSFKWWNDQTSSSYQHQYVPCMLNLMTFKLLLSNVTWYFRFWSQLQ